MITRHLFFPENIGSYYLFSQAIAAISIDTKAVRAVVVTASGRTRKVQQIIEEPIVNEGSLSLSEATTLALRHVLDRIPTKCMLIATLPSNLVVYKTINVPFMSHTKLKQLIPFEVEASLPFPLTDACIDSIVVGNTGEEKKESVALVAVTRRDTLNEYLAPFNTLGKQPDHVSTDVISLCALIYDLSQLHQQEKPFMLMCIEQSSSVLLLIEPHRITHVRTLSYGTMHFQEDAPMNSPLIHLLSTTLSSYVNPTLQEIIICGSGADYASLATALTTALDVRCTLFPLNKLLHDHNMRSEMSLGNQLLIPLVTALPTPISQVFDLNTEHATQVSTSFMTRQIILSLIFLVVTLVALISVRIITVRQLNAEIKTAEQETIKLLSAELKLPLNPGAAKSLDVVMSTAQAYVSSQEKMWFSLSNQHRAMILQALEELSKLVDRKELGLQLQKLSINESDGEMIMTLTGSVGEFKALDKLQEQIKTSTRLRLLEKIPNTSFVTKLAVTTGEGS